MVTRHAVKVGRIYEDPLESDGTRLLVDRLWPRGLTKEKAHIDEWCKVLAPSPALRKWYAHDPGRFEEFGRRYRIELEAPEAAAALDRLRALSRHGPLTLLTATKDAAISEAAVLSALIQPASPPASGPQT
ncbi:DUF488 domain-containing protein [Pseudarthrobacter sp. H2]|uniref:DUF488 domain-containing protein n=1 Tax=Pseudarthrobacter sp. H2 TaxID=3418415 RepID=UPI003CF8E7A8